MAERRPLSVATHPVPNADPEAVRAFITQERPQQPTSVPIGNEQPSKLEAQTKPVAAIQSTQTMSATSIPRKRPKPAFQPVGLIPVTVRLRPEIAGALKRASLERQLEGEEVFTQQDLVERALEPWLRQEGFIA